jgi:hypothetical protein
VLLLGIGSWRLGLFDGVIDGAFDVARGNLRARMGHTAPAPAPVAPVVAPAPPAAGPLAKKAKLRIVTEPEGADVLEEKDGLPRLLGTTPLTVSWDVQKEPAPRRLVLRKAGFVAATATVQPPLAADREPVRLEVKASLRAIKR